MGNKKYQVIILLSWLILVMGLVTLVMTRNPISFGLIIVSLLLLVVGYMIRVHEARQDEQTKESKEVDSEAPEEIK